MPHETRREAWGDVLCKEVSGAWSESTQSMVQENTVENGDKTVEGISNG